MASSLLHDLSEWGSHRDLGLSEEAHHQARLAFLDTLACMLVGMEQPSTQALAAVLSKLGQPGPAATFCRGWP